MNYKLERRSTWTWESGARRSSVAVMALHVRKNEKRHKKYFSKSVALKPQSRSAVHYLVSKKTIDHNYHMNVIIQYANTLFFKQF